MLETMSKEEESRDHVDARLDDLKKQYLASVAEVQLDRQSLS